jgi:hypothetical protein
MKENISIKESHIVAIVIGPSKKQKKKKHNLF